ncbi:YrhK family protein [Lacticigenium naphthae]|uniref:YrhK family protein n=1 Tax=Lacticigenium naphthae TaxID=515351 RepID=UPI000405E3A4|nr:YrhK family protein [Lacticigenium naphthae]
MPKVEKKPHEVGPSDDEDVIIKTRGIKFYFENYYSIISLVNDILIGLMYFVGSLGNLLGAPEIFGLILYILGAFFLLLRPLIRIFRKIWFYVKWCWSVFPEVENRTVFYLFLCAFHCSLLFYFFFFYKR